MKGNSKQFHTLTKEHQSYSKHLIKDMSKQDIDHFGYLHVFNDDYVREDFPCKSGATISITMVNDFVPDCGLKLKMNIFSVILQQRLIFIVSTKVKFHLEKDISYIIESSFKNISEICTYKLNSMTHLTPCRTGEHLQNCREFNCNMKFKCLDYYCISGKYVCDGKWDCSHGYDKDTHKFCNSTKE